MARAELAVRQPDRWKDSAAAALALVDFAQRCRPRLNLFLRYCARIAR